MTGTSRSFLLFHVVATLSSIKKRSKCLYCCVRDKDEITTSSGSRKKSDTWSLEKYRSLYYCVSSSLWTSLKSGRRKVVCFESMKERYFCPINLCSAIMGVGASFAPKYKLLVYFLLVTNCLDLLKIPNTCITFFAFTTRVLVVGSTQTVSRSSDGRNGKADTSFHSIHRSILTDQVIVYTYHCHTK